ncbi:diaminopimelate epimerase [Prochlorococcus sp. MIT 1223]|uniref:diaminopimelate epimerase n=1 Tax=Prochlorococcus sp. MIT 1223 TaxID=3096217 RepID=UPI002A753676|nr:diaminopimelate epimerase [Prochlorococcus sp. MIT 1223]
MNQLELSKYQGIGNDFLLFDGRNNPDFEALLDSTVVQRICDRKFGLGADGLIIAMNSNSCDFRMRIINSDGSEPEMCGNGIRCLVKYILDSDTTSNKNYSYKIETIAGVIEAEYKSNDLITVNMGRPYLEPYKIPTTLPLNNIGIPCGEFIDQENRFKIYSVGMGNPHLITYIEQEGDIDINKYGEILEKNKYFPQKTNVHFVKVNSAKSFNMYTWERGCGITFACGTGACACAVASNLLGYCDDKVRVNLLGGVLDISWNGSNSSVYMTGPAKHVYKAWLNLEDIL